MTALAQDNHDYSLLQPSNNIRILAVDDDIVSMGFLEAQIDALNHEMLKATEGAQALNLLRQQAHSIDVVLMDREMPTMDGLTAVKHMKSDPILRSIPVIMVTGADSAEEMREGMDAGVFYYLTKPVKEDTLKSVLTAAVREAQQSQKLAEELGKHRSSFDQIETCRFTFQTIEQAESLAVFMANCFPDAQRVVAGLGELLINAIEHGNLGIGYDLKTELIEQNIWRSELSRRQELPDYKDKTAKATIARKPDGIYAIIEDEGAGFNWQRYLTIDPSRAGDNHGRGIALANASCFDKLNYNELGNQVVAFASHTPQLDW